MNIYIIITHYHYKITIIKLLYRYDEWRQCNRNVGRKLQKNIEH